MKHPKIPQWKLERYVLGELPEADMAMIQEELEKDSSLKERYEEILQSDEEIRASLPVLNFDSVRVEEKVAEPSKFETIVEKLNALFSIPHLQAVGAFGVMLLVVGIVYLNNPGSNSIGTDNTSISENPYGPTRDKTVGPNIKIYRKDNSSVVLLHSGDTASMGDQLQIRYSAKGAKYGFIFSVDGNDLITKHLPTENYNAAILNNDSAGISLDRSYILDNAPKFERFYFVTSNNSFSISEIERSAEIMIRKGSTEMRLNPGQFQYMIELKKE